MIAAPLIQESVGSSSSPSTDLGLKTRNVERCCQHVRQGIDSSTCATLSVVAVS
jgi:hypothetical protein